jgi:hypothetical protein
MNHHAENIFRRELWLRHGFGHRHLYGDDGEMQCAECGLDFKRDSAEKIAGRLKEMDLAVEAHAKTMVMVPPERLADIMRVVSQLKKLLEYVEG